jgi:hypothetical protein
MASSKTNESEMGRHFDNYVNKFKEGIVVNKLNVKRQSFDGRNYVLDLINYRLVANTKEIGKTEKCCKNF